MTDEEASQRISIRPVPTDEEAVTITASILAAMNRHQDAPASRTSPRPDRWSRAARHEMILPFERSPDDR
jgi:hypothetical protein